MADPQLAAVGFFKRVTHPTEGEIVFTELPVRFAETGVCTQRLQPRLGEHGIEVLREAELVDGDIDALIASGATIDGRPKTPAAK